MFRDLKKNNTKLPPRSTLYKANLKELVDTSMEESENKKHLAVLDASGREVRSLSRMRNLKKEGSTIELFKLNEQVIESDYLNSPRSPDFSQPNLIPFTPFDGKDKLPHDEEQLIFDETHDDANAPIEAESDTSASRKSTTAHLTDRVHDLVIKLDSMKGNLDHSVTDLTLSCAHLHTRIAQNLKHCAEQYLDSIVQEIHYLAKSEIPEIYLKSIPKFAIANEENVELHRTLVSLKTSAQNVIFPNSLIEKIKYDIRELFNRKFESLNTELQTANSKLETFYHNIGSSSEQLEEMLFEMKTEILLLLERVERGEIQSMELREELEAQEMHMKEKEVMMDILRDQVTRRDDLLDEQRTSFHRELLSLKMTLMERSNSRTENFYFGSGGTQFELNTQMKQSQKAMEEKLEKHVGEIKKSFLREKRNLLYEKKIALEEKEAIINDLKRKCRRYEEKLASLHSDVSFSSEDNPAPILNNDQKTKSTRTEPLLPLIR